MAWDSLDDGVWCLFFSLIATMNVASSWSVGLLSKIQSHARPVLHVHNTGFFFLLLHNNHHVPLGTWYVVYVHSCVLYSRTAIGVKKQGTRKPFHRFRETRTPLHYRRVSAVRWKQRGSESTNNTEASWTQNVRNKEKASSTNETLLWETFHTMHNKNLFVTDKKKFDMFPQKVI